MFQPPFGDPGPMLDDWVGFIHRQSNPNRWYPFNYMVTSKAGKYSLIFQISLIPRFDEERKRHFPSQN